MRLIAARFGTRIGALAAATLLWGCSGQEQEVIETSEPVPVMVQTVQRGSLRSVIATLGVVRPAPGAELIVTAPQAARILELPKAEGDPVRQGDVLARFEIPALDAEVASRQAELRQARARLESARAAAARAEGLFERGIAARREVEETERDLAEAQAAVEQAQSAVEAAGVLARRETVRAPFDGVVAARRHNPGDLVDSSDTDPVLRFIDPQRLVVEAQVPLSDLPGLDVASPARVLPPSGAPAETGRLASRPAAVDSATAAVKLRIDFTQPTALAVGTPVRVEILGQQHDNVILVPSSAVVQEGPNSFVYLVDQKQQAHRREVEVGIVAEGRAEIRSGVKVGDRVVVEAQSALPDGAAVTPRR